MAMTVIKDDTHDHADEQYLKDTHPEMPCHRSQGTEIDLTERDKQNEKHEQGEDGCKDRLEEKSCLIKCRCEGEEQIERCPQSHGQGQRPVFYQALYHSNR